MSRLLQRGPALHAVMGAWPWLATAAGYASGSSILYPILCLIPAYAAMVALLRAGRRRRAVAAMLVWALGLGSAGTAFAAWFPERGAAVTIHGPEYREEMFHWLRTGEGAEGDPSRFLPQHAAHAGIFAVLSLLSASFLSMAFGTVLMNYMGFYVGCLFQAAETPAPILILGWPVWALLRIGAFVVLGVVLAEPLLHRFFRHAWGWRDAAPYAVAAIGGLLTDVLLKGFFASAWRSWLLAALGSAFGGG